MKRILTALLGWMGVSSNLSAEQRHDLASAGYQAAPSVVVAGAAGGAGLAGLSLNEWLILFSIGFIILQAAYLVWKWRKAAVREQLRDALRERAAAAIAQNQGADRSRP